jgi:hypothetical protein
LSIRQCSWIIKQGLHVVRIRAGNLCLQIAVTSAGFGVFEQRWLRGCLPWSSADVHCMLFGADDALFHSTVCTLMQTHLPQAKSLSAPMSKEETLQRHIADT